MSGEATPKRALTAHSDPAAQVAVDGTSRVSSVRAPRHVATQPCRRRDSWSTDTSVRRAAAHVVERAPTQLQPVTADQARAAAHLELGGRPGARVDPPQSAGGAVVEDEGAVGQPADAVGVDVRAVVGRPLAGEGQERGRLAGPAAAPVQRDPGEPVDAGVGDPHGIPRDDQVVEERAAGHEHVGHDGGARGVDGPHVGLGAEPADRPDQAGAVVAVQAAQGAPGGGRQEHPRGAAEQVAGDDPAVGDGPDVVGGPGAGGDALRAQPVGQGHRVGRAAGVVGVAAVGERGGGREGGRGADGSEGERAASGQGTGGVLGRVEAAMDHRAHVNRSDGGSGTGPKVADRICPVSVVRWSTWT